MKSKVKPRPMRAGVNAYKDLGVASPEEALAKARLAARIAEIITERGWTQVAAAKVLGIDQPKVSALLRGKLSSFSLERLMRFLTVLGRNVEIVVRDRPRAHGPGHLQVLTA